jgi:hypothetical protein
MALAALAILGHRSAHSFPIGLVIADPANRTDNAQGALEIQFKKKKKNRKKKPTRNEFH